MTTLTEGATLSGFVFISYSRADAGYVRHLVEHLRQAGVDVWVDTEGVGYGDRWETVLRHRVDACAALIVVMSPSAETSQHVGNEIDRGRNRHKPIIPILLSGEVFYQFGAIHYFDARRGRLPDAGLLTRITELTSDAAVFGSSAVPVRPDGAAPVLGRPIRACDPLALEVHRAIDVPHGKDQLSPLPAYVARAHDQRLRQTADQVMDGASRMITLVGGSSTGKTRACWELVQYIEQQQPGRWRLWHPYDPTRAQAAADEISEVDSHAVVWLNEAQLYLAPPDQHLGERIASGLRTLLLDAARGPVLILATMWPSHWTILTSRPENGLGDKYPQVRELLSGTGVDVPDAFSPTELVDLDARGDPRLTRAGRYAAGGRITQYLAGAPLLLDRYHTAGPAARAVLDVAIDARRLGHPPGIPRSLLEQAAPSHLDDDQWNLVGDDWLEKALAYLTQPCNGTRGPLTLLRLRPGEPAQSTQPVYRLADYLEQTGARKRADVYPSSGFWRAAASVIEDVATLHTLGMAAEHRGRYRHAADLYTAAADRGDGNGFSSLARLREQVGDSDGTTALYRRAAELGNTAALNHLAFRCERAGDLDDAADLYRRAADLGNTGALRALTRLRERGVARDTSVSLTTVGTESNNIRTSGWPALRRADVVDLDSHSVYRESVSRDNPNDRIARLRRQASERADTRALVVLSMIRERAGDIDGAVSAACQAADRGQTGVLSQLALRRERAGDSATAVRLARESADRGNPVVLSNLARRRERDGDLGGAARLYGEAADRGHINALIHLARLRELAGDPEGARNIQHFGLDADGSPAQPWDLPQSIRIATDAFPAQSEAAPVDLRR